MKVSYLEHDLRNNGYVYVDIDEPDSDVHFRVTIPTFIVSGRHVQDGKVFDYAYEQDLGWVYDSSISDYMGRVKAIYDSWYNYFINDEKQHLELIEKISRKIWDINCFQTLMLLFDRNRTEAIQEYNQLPSLSDEEL